MINRSKIIDGRYLLALLVLLMAAPPVSIADDADLLVPARQQALIDCIAALRAEVDNILLVLPPLSSRAEADTAAQLADDVLLAVRWGESDMSDASEALESSSTLSSKLIGAVFTADHKRDVDRYNA